MAITLTHDDQCQHKLINWSLYCERCKLEIGWNKRRKYAYEMRQTSLGVYVFVYGLRTMRDRFMDGVSLILRETKCKES